MRVPNKFSRGKVAFRQAFAAPTTCRESPCACLVEVAHGTINFAGEGSAVEEFII
jgi:hypothetical protein